MNKYGLCQSVNDEYEVWLEVWADNLTIEKIEKKVTLPWSKSGFYEVYWVVVADGVRIRHSEEVIIEEINGKNV